MFNSKRWWHCSYKDAPWSRTFNLPPGWSASAIPWARRTYDIRDLFGDLICYYTVPDADEIKQFRPVPKITGDQMLEQYCWQQYILIKDG